MTDYFVVTMAPLGQPQGAIFHKWPPEVHHRTKRLAAGALVLYGPRPIPPEYADMTLDELMALWRAMKAGTAPEAKPRVRVPAPALAPDGQG